MLLKPPQSPLFGVMESMRHCPFPYREHLWGYQWNANPLSSNANRAQPVLFLEQEGCPPLLGPTLEGKAENVRTTLTPLNYFVREIKRRWYPHLLCLQSGVRFAETPRKNDQKKIWSFPLSWGRVRAFPLKNGIPTRYHPLDISWEAPTNKSFSPLGAFPRNVGNVEGRQEIRE